MDNTNVCPQGLSHPLSAPWCPNSAPPSSSAAGAVSVWVWIRDVTCAETVPTAQTRATAVSPETHISEVYLWADLRSGALWDWEVCLCPAVDCVLSPWTSWSQCSVSCGLGSLFRQRSILRDARSGGSCGGAQFDSRACFLQACPGTNMFLY